MTRWNLQRISHFLEVVGAESLSQAARNIGLSQPSLTASIRKLEAELGFELFDRKRGFELTALGQQFLPRAKEVVMRIQELERDMEQVGSGEAGLVRLGCGPAVADGVMGGALAELIRTRPSLRLQVRVVPFGDLRGMLDSHEIDFAMGDRSIGIGQEEYEVIALPKHEILFFCRSGHPLADKSQVGVEDFFKYPLLGQQLPVEAQAWLRSHHPDGLAVEGLALQCSHYALLKKVIAESDAISGAPYEVIKNEVERGEMVVLKTIMPPMMTQAVVVKLKHRRLAPAAMELIGLLSGG